MGRDVDVVRKIEFPTQNTCFRSFAFSARCPCYLREGKTAAGDTSLDRWALSVDLRLKF